MLYVSGKVQGKIYLEQKDSFIYAEEMEHAQIIFLYDVTRYVDGKINFGDKIRKEKQHGASYRYYQR